MITLWKKNRKRWTNSMPACRNAPKESIMLKASRKSSSSCTNSFSKNALPKETERLGIVYTPVEVVDFIIQSVEYVMRNGLIAASAIKVFMFLIRSPEPELLSSGLLRSALSNQKTCSISTPVRFIAMKLILLAYYIAR